MIYILDIKKILSFIKKQDLLLFFFSTIKIALFRQNEMRLQ